MTVAERATLPPPYLPPARPPRFALWLPNTERRLWCPRGHHFTPRNVMYRGAQTERCGKCPSGDRPLVLLIGIPEFDHHLIAQVTLADLRHIAERQMSALTEIAYLLTTPPREP